jgi:hypothetical protein
MSHFDTPLGATRQPTVVELRQVMFAGVPEGSAPPPLEPSAGPLGALPLLGVGVVEGVPPPELEEQPVFVQTSSAPFKTFVPGIAAGGPTTPAMDSPSKEPMGRTPFAGVVSGPCCDDIKTCEEQF